MKQPIVLNRAVPKNEPEATGPWRAVYRLLVNLTARVNDLSSGGVSVKVGPAMPINKAELDNLHCRDVTLGGVTFTALTKESK